MATLPISPMCCFIAPPDLLDAVLESGNEDEQAAARRTRQAAETARAQRVSVTGALRQLALTIADVAPAPGRVRTVYDAGNRGYYALPGRRVRGEGDPAVPDEAVNDAYDGSGLTYDFYREVFGRDSIDGRGLEIVSSVHYERDHDNAAWTGFQMIYGDGSGRVFRKGALTKAIDVIGHELTHGVTQFTAQLVYSKQSGALNESFSDVFGSLVKQYSRGQSAEEADWLIGEGILGTALQGVALRSMKAPGTAWTTAAGGGDRQPAHMRDYVDLPDDGDPANDNGGVHINSGIPNHAFYLAATAMGGNAWERAGRIWYVTLTERLRARSDFREAAEATVAVAGELFGADGTEHKCVRDAWRQVGVLDG
ncbi:Zn-dependent metalloprotease [Thermocatellispora tengchongensis]|uniref:Neutral metalloproteinase n=1 Tax=Thermocatellispora tengchongensis TaxID=1073253 RepID=A0A840PMG7_9ACTN|nr:M4 family metallopeptidase [Thermocatellispora tengchongensis]MBB5140139.1 Zn-dependent metalloprotease [Thermocatellispora tengchongensis]